MTLDSERLTLHEAYLAMYEFIVELYQRTNSGDLGSLLGDISLLSDGTTADPAAWRDWLQCVEKARRGGIDAGLVITRPPR